VYVHRQPLPSHKHVNNNIVVVAVARSIKLAVENERVFLNVCVRVSTLDNFMSKKFFFRNVHRKTMKNSNEIYLSEKFYRFFGHKINQILFNDMFCDYSDQKSHCYE
jgi:hypothetical protein